MKRQTGDEIELDEIQQAHDTLLGDEKSSAKIQITSNQERPARSINHVYTLNEAIDGAGKGIFHILLLFVCGFCMMGVIMETLVMSYIITSAECDLSLSQVAKGLLTGAAFFGVVLSSHFWGILSDIWGRRSVLLLAVAGCFTSSLWSCFSPNAVILIITRTLVGVFVAANAAISYAYLGEFHSDKTRARAVTMSGVFMAFGMICLPALAWAIIPLGRDHTFIAPLIGVELASWRLYLLIISLFNGFAFVGLLFLPESPKFLLVKHRQDKAIKSLHRVYKFNCRGEQFNIKQLVLEDEEMAEKTDILNPAKLVWNQTTTLFKKRFICNTFKTSFTMGAIFFASSGLYLWTPDILSKMVQNRNGTMTTCEAVNLAIETKDVAKNINCATQEIDTFPFVATLIMSVIFAVCYFLNGIVVNKIGKRNLLLIWSTICGLSSIVLVYTSNFVLIQIFMVTLLASGCCGSLISAISFDLFPTTIKATALCLILMCGRLCAALGSNIIGWLLVINCNAVFWLVGVVLLACTGVGLLIPGP